ncbi:MAG: ABC transporter permease, partial [Mycoplasma sp.]
YRRFNAIDFTTTNSGFAYKIVESDPNHTIDKMVMYQGNNVLSRTYDFDQLIEEANWVNDDIKSAEARRIVVFLASKASWTDTKTGPKFIKANEQLTTVKDPTDINYDPKTSQDSSVTKIKGDLEKWLNGKNPLINKGYRLAFDVSGTVPVVGRIDNFSSYTTVVPTYVLKNHGKEIVPDYLYEEYFNMNKFDSLTTQSDFIDWFAKVPSKYKISVDNLDFLIVGTGMTPGFMYPVLNLERSIPNTETEILLYGNTGAFELAYDSNRSSPVDDYLIFNVGGASQELINELNIISRKYMSWPPSIKSVYFANDISNTLCAQGVRLNFLPGLIDTQIILSTTLSLFVGALTCIVFLFTVRKFIDDNRSSLTILRANGVKKRVIVFSTTILGVFPSLVGGSFAYLVCQLTQNALIGLFSTYWVIPTAVTIFNPLMFFGILLAPLVIMAILAAATTFLLMRKNVSELMKDTSNFKVTPIAKMMAVLFNKADIITKFRTSIAFSSISKLIAITVLFTLSSIGVTTSTALSKKFKTAKEATFEAKDYNFAVDLTTPTVQAGQYLSSEFKDLDRVIVDDNYDVLTFNSGMVDNGGLFPGESVYNKMRNQTFSELKYLQSDMNPNPKFAKNVALPKYNENIKTTKAKEDSIAHMPSINDATWQKESGIYLNNRSQTPLLVDLEIGIGNLSTNPWNIARNLAPPNTMNISDNMTHELWRRIANDSTVYFTNDSIDFKETIVPYGGQINKDNYLDFELNKIYIDKFNFLVKYNDIPDQNDLNYVYKENDGWYYIDKSKFAETSALNKDYLVLSHFILNNDKYQDTIFKMSYNRIPLESGDETFTRVESNLLTNNAQEAITIKGIKNNSNFLKLKNKNQEDINNILKLNDDIEQKYEEINKIHEIYRSDIFDDSSNFKMIINESAAYQYNLKIGDVIKIDPTNEATRFNAYDILTSDADKEKVVDYSEFNNKTYEFQIIEIAETYQYPEFFINQRIANHINVMSHENVLKTSFKNDYIYNESTNNDEIIVSQIDPFNGVFSDAENVKAISQSMSLYSETGIAPATDKFTSSTLMIDILNTALKSKDTDLNNWKNQTKYLTKMQLAKIMGYEKDGVLNMTAFSEKYNDASLLLKDMVSIYGENPFTPIIFNVEYVEMYSQIFDNISKFINDIMILILVILFSISILSVAFLSVEFISSSISLIAILKVLGFYDRTNAFAFLSMFFPAMIIAVAASVPLSMLIIEAIKKFVYSFANIFLPISYQWWYFIVPSLLLGAILAMTIGIAMYLLKKQNTTRVIARY